MIDSPFKKLLTRVLCLETLAIHLTCIVSVFLLVWQPLPMCELIRKSGQLAMELSFSSRVMAQGVNAVVSEVPKPQFTAALKNLCFS